MQKVEQGHLNTPLNDLKAKIEINNSALSSWYTPDEANERKVAFCLHIK